LAAKWKRNRPDRLDRLAQAIELLGDHDRNLVDESARAGRLRIRGATELHAICQAFIGALNEKLSKPAVLLDPSEYSEDRYRDGAPCLFQINLRGRLLQLEFEATGELYSREDFRRPYVLSGAVRSFNQELLDHNTIGEKAIFYCPEKEDGYWYYFDSRTYRTGRLTQDFLIAELQKLL
jgi:hypothetical protein